MIQLFQWKFFVDQSLFSSTNRNKTIGIAKSVFQAESMSASGIYGDTSRSKLNSQFNDDSLNCMQQAFC